jgi:DNA-binding MarR family transcriptional regulator
VSISDAGAALIETDHASMDDYHLQEQIGFVLRKANQRHLAIFGARISDLTPPQFAALAKLHEIGETSQNQLGALIAMDAATVKGVIDRLKARGLVDFGKHQADKRLLMVKLTGDGVAMIERLIPLAEVITRETLAPLTGREIATLMRLLSKIA